MPVPPGRPLLWDVWSDRATEERWLVTADRRFHKWVEGRATRSAGAKADTLPPVSVKLVTTAELPSVPLVEGIATETTHASEVSAAVKLTPTVQPIPKIVHHIWLGSSLPARAAAMRATWEYHHLSSDGWRFILWDDAAVAQVLAESRKPLPRKLSSKAAVSAAPAQKSSGATTATTSAASPQLHATTLPNGALTRQQESIPASSTNDMNTAPPVSEPSRPSVRITNLAAYEAATNWGEKSDVLRYEILNQVSTREFDQYCVDGTFLAFCRFMHMCVYVSMCVEFK